MRTYRYHRVDVFTEEIFGGNPLVVFPEAEGLSDREMQNIAREMNLSETVFCFAPSTGDAHVRMRIFTVDRELPMAGHPVVGTHYVLASTGRYDHDGRDFTVQAELPAGVLPADVLFQEGELRSVVMTQRAPSFGEPYKDQATLAKALGVDESALDFADMVPMVVDTGVPWFVIPMRDLRAIRSLVPYPGLCGQIAEQVGTDMFYAFTQETEDAMAAAHARHVWFGAVTPGEDPVTGSAAGCLGSYLVQQEVLLAAPGAQAFIEQGVEVGRPGMVEVLVDVKGNELSRVRVGGHAVHLGDGEIRLDDIS